MMFKDYFWQDLENIYDSGKQSKPDPCKANTLPAFLLLIFLFIWGKVSIYIRWVCEYFSHSVGVYYLVLFVLFSSSCLFLS